ncbi:NAD(P)H-hydrate dehydratase [Halocatena pleomorpha]|uniref:Bifunctional NAD(P)H-hydrate repair enzyme n=1 Tax=Halocatena pleomorpha TaxID=1785090 RepID=A0A3P3RL49_9EURY|nr:NAD(P)H-hydrate dehydratase [Halocatena pleomorpha]RRJ33618.1 NAD(P)H-hydrate dehydratase [Halocatena pleomorpha]
MITIEEMAVVDANAAALGVPRKQLMESSGRAVARVVREHAEPDDDVVIVAGRGNNGGDSFVATRFLDAYDPTVLLLGRAKTISTEISWENWVALNRGEYDIREARDSRDLDLGTPDLIVDGILGTGVRGAPREPAHTAIERINESDGTVVSVDVPSGMDANSGTVASVAVDADHTVTFHDMKPGLESPEQSVTVADIGIPAMADTLVERGDLLRLGRAPNSHKGDNGTVLVIGGGPYTGAPALTAQAALAAGADIVRVACPTAVAETVQSFNEGLITTPLTGDRLDSDHVTSLLEAAAEVDVAVLGPGLGAHDESLAAAQSFISSFDGTCVVDADPLGVVPDAADTDASLVCTPHAGEFRRMGGDPSDSWRDRMDDVRTLATDLGVTVLLKGRYDVIADGSTGRTRVNRSGTPEMTVGGTGDVLAGIVGAFASVLDPIHAAAIGAYINGRAGERASNERASISPLDLIENVPVVLDA